MKVDMEDRHNGLGEVELAQFATKQRYETLPPRVTEQVKLVLLDTVGIMIRGTTDPDVARLRGALISGGLGSATVIGSTSKAIPAVAAFLNGCLPTVTQYDEGYRNAMGHPAIHIIPAALASAETEAASGRDLITAIAVGYEVGVRVGLSVFPLNSLVHPHGNWPTLGAAVSVGKLLSFSETEFMHVINATSNLCLFSWGQATRSGGTIHHLVPGLGASHAVIAALAVRAGLSGPARSLEDFFLPLSSPEPKPHMLTHRLGSSFEILNNYFKKYPTCAHAHSSIQALESITREHALTVDDVESVEVKTYSRAARLVNPSPTNPLAAMFSIPYCLGNILVKGRLSVEDFTAEALLDAEVLRASSLIRIVKDETLRPAYPEGRPARVKVCLKDGTEHEAFVGLPDERTSRGEVEDKFRRMVVPVVGELTARELIGLVCRLDSVPDVREFCQFLSFESASSQQKPQGRRVQGLPPTTGGVS